MLAGAGHLQEWPPWLVALTFGLASGLSFPAGAAIGVYTTPSEACKSQWRNAASEVRERWVAGMMAFGAGCLLFAVTVELYGAAMAELELNGYESGAKSIFVTIVFALLGAIGYIHFNRRLAEWLKDARSTGEVTEETPLTQPSATRSASDEQHERRILKMLIVGMESWFGVLVSGIPEGVLLGMFASQGRLSLVLVLSLFVSNFPTALSSASLLKSGGRTACEILGLWTFVFVGTGLLAGIMPVLAPGGGRSMGMQLFSDAIEGLAGGSMLACICAVMLPEAYHVQGDTAGLMTVVGFLAAVVIKVFGGMIEDLTTYMAPTMEGSPGMAAMSGPGLPVSVLLHKGR